MKMVSPASSSSLSLDLSDVCCLFWPLFYFLQIEMRSPPNLPLQVVTIAVKILTFFLNLRLEHIDPVVTLDTHDNHPVHVKDLMKAS